MEILLVIFIVYCLYLVNKWLDRRSAEKFVQKICGKQ